MYTIFRGPSIKFPNFPGQWEPWLTVLTVTGQCLTSSAVRSATLIVKSTSSTAAGVLIHLRRCLPYVNLSSNWQHATAGNGSEFDLSTASIEVKTIHCKQTTTTDKLLQLTDWAESKMLRQRNQQQARQIHQSTKSAQLNGSSNSARLVWTSQNVLQTTITQQCTHDRR